MEIKDAHILVTGGSLGIGKATAKALIDKGAQVVITGRNKARLEEAAEEIGAIPLVFDISDLDSIEKKAKECLEALDYKIDVLINNAGLGNFPDLGEIKKSDFEQIFNTNVFGLALLTQEMVKPMKKFQSGTIINLGSTASLRGFAKGTVYAASKFALRGMTQSWQHELRRDNIRVCLVNPSSVMTAFNQEDRVERDNKPNMLDSNDIAHTITSIIEMDDKGFIPEVSIWATNPF